MKAFLTQVMIKSNVEALIYVMWASQRNAYTAPLAVCPPPKKTDLIKILQDQRGGGQNAKELSVSMPLISTHD